MKLRNQLKLLFPRKRKNLPRHLQEGVRGETAAARYLFRHGYELIDRNFVSGKNEIDIIAKRKSIYVFCEVKTRVLAYGESAVFGRPAAAVTESKQRCLIAAAAKFIGRHKREECFYRFDVIEVYLSPKLHVSHIHHIENAFMQGSYKR